MQISRLYRFFDGLIFAAILLLPLAASSQQNLFVADFNDNTVRQFTPVGAESTNFSDPTHPPGVSGLTFDSQGDLFVANSNDGFIYKITPAGIQTVFDTGIFDSVSLATDSHDNVFVATYFDRDIYKITPGGLKTTFDTLVRPAGLVFNSSGDLFVSTGTNSIVKYAANGPESLYYSGLPDSPLVMTFDAAGDLYEADNSGNIYEITSTGVLNSFATGLAGPEGLAFDNVGDLFVSLAGANSIDEYRVESGVLSSTPVVFASGLDAPNQLVFHTPVPEASSPMLFAAGAALLYGHRCLRRRAS